VGFFAQGKLKKVDITAGSPQILCDAPNGRGATWNVEGQIIFTPSNPGPLSSVSAAGGQPVQITKLRASETNHRFPYFLPDSKHFLYLATGTTENSVFVGNVDSTEPVRLLTADSAAIYAPPSYLLFVRQGTLLAQRFDSSTLQLQGDAVAVVDQVAFDGSFRSFSVSDNGVLTYRTGAGVPTFQLGWFDRTGKLISQVGVPAEYLGPNLSPDGQRLAIHRHDANGGDIWIIEISRGTISRFTFDPTQDNSMPVWSPDGNRIAFGSLRNGKWGLYIKQADGTGNEELLLESELTKMPMSWSPDGKYIAYWIYDPKTNSDEWVVPLTGDRKPFPVLQTPLNEQWPEISPDGKWIAYTSNETGSTEIYVRPFPNGTGKWQVSTNGGIFPRWRRDGKELYYLSVPNSGKLMAAEIRVEGSSFQTETPHALFDSGYININHATNYHVFAVSADGQKFLIPRPAGGLAADIAGSPITVVVNWTAALNKK
jgi:eukaryotic-like serine/threonine-protein kinase